MRYQGRIVEWRDERGFGFVRTNGTDDRVFVHVSELANREQRLTLGALVTYEIGKDATGRVRARDIALVGHSSSKLSYWLGFLGPVLFLGLAAVAIAYVAWVRMTHPNSSIAASVYKIVHMREALPTDATFQCGPAKSSCSAMTSCAEAFFHLERCGVPNMDGDRDGIPCEQQWCR